MGEDYENEEGWLENMHQLKTHFQIVKMILNTFTIHKFRHEL
jgi:hypothetical protein